MIEGRFDGGNMTSDGGVMLLAALGSAPGIDRRRSTLDCRPLRTTMVERLRALALNDTPWRMRRSMPCEINYSSSWQSSPEIRAASDKC